MLNLFYFFHDDHFFPPSTLTLTYFHYILLTSLNPILMAPFSIFRNVQPHLCAPNGPFSFVAVYFFFYCLPWFYKLKFFSPFFKSQNIFSELMCLGFVFYLCYKISNCFIVVIITILINL